MKDIIQDVLDTVRFKTAVYFKYGFCGNWGMSVPIGEFAQFHFVAGGNCVLNIDEQTYDLSKGDLVIFPKSYPHRIKATETATCKSGQSVVMEILAGNDPFKEKGNISSTLVCGHYELDKTVSHFILSDLPEFIIIKNEEYGRFDMIDNILNNILDELSLQKIGYQTITIRLAEILFISILRHHYTKQSLEKLNLFKDEAIYKSVNYIHNNLHSELNIKILSRFSGISRTLFIQRFKRVVGKTPLAYIKSWRMTKAQQLLKHSKLSLGEIGSQIGYNNSAAFNRVFKTTFDISPKKFRDNFLTY